MEITRLSNPSITNQYWNLVQQMNDMEKLDLIMILTQSLRGETKTTESASQFYGIWGDDGMSADEAVWELKSMRSFNRKSVQS